MTVEQPSSGRGFERDPAAVAWMAVRETDLGVQPFVVDGRAECLGQTDNLVKRARSARLIADDDRRAGTGEYQSRSVTNRLLASHRRGDGAAVRCRYPGFLFHDIDG